MVYLQYKQNKSKISMIKTINIYTKEIVYFKDVSEILKEINRDRSDQWEEYNECDWKEGLEEFTEYRLVK